MPRNISDIFRYKQAKRNKAGSSLQTLIETANDRYQVDGLAIAMTINTGFIPTGIRHPKTHQMLYMPGKKVWADVTGGVSSGPRKGMFVAELKNRIDTTCSMGSYKVTRALEEHQLELLNKADSMGHWAMVILWAQFKGMPQPIMARLDWPFQPENGFKVDADVLKQHEIPFKRGVFDYLGLYE
jgi:hypothetical protein